MIERARYLGEDVNRAASIVGRARPVAHLVCNAVKLVLVEDQQVTAPGQVLAQQPVGVFACSAPWGAVRVAEVDLYARAIGQLLVPAQLLALVLTRVCRIGSAIELSLAVKASSAEATVASFNFSSSVSRVVRSTSTPTSDLFSAPRIRSPSQRPGITQPFTSGGCT